MLLSANARDRRAAFSGFPNDRISPRAAASCNDGYVSMLRIYTGFPHPAGSLRPWVMMQRMNFFCFHYTGKPKIVNDCLFVRAKMSGRDCRSF